MIVCSEPLCMPGQLDPMLVLRPLHEHFAAELRGLDISRPLHAAQLKEVQGAWSRHAVLVIRGQAISDEQQLAFAKQFGALEAFPPPADGRRGGPELLRISNVRADGTFLPPTDTTMKYLSMGTAWHKDTTY